MKKVLSIIFAALLLCIISVSVFAESGLATVNSQSVVQNPALGADVVGQAGAAEGGGQNFGPQIEDPTATPENLDPTSKQPPHQSPPMPTPDPYPGQASSIISDGTVWIIVAVTVLAVAVFAAVLVYKKKKKN